MNIEKLLANFKLYLEAIQAGKTRQREQQQRQLFEGGFVVCPVGGESDGNALSDLLHQLIEEVVTSDAVMEVIANRPICYTAEEAAQLLHCSQRTIEDAYRDGDLVGSKLGRSPTFTREALREFHRHAVTR